MLCNLCGEKFSSTDKLQPHLESHKEGRRQCPVCHLWLRVTTYQGHMITHTHAKPFKCGKCPYATKHENALKVHRRRHDDNRVKHACPLCHKKLSTKRSLKNHILRHGEGKYKCPLCPKDFLYRSALKRHIRLLHYKTSIVNPFRCGVCARSFPFKSGLKVHMARHSDDRNYKCRFCEKAFNCNSDVRQHENVVHFKQKKVANLPRCEVCGKSFANEASLYSHKKIHATGKPQTLEV